MYMYIKKIDTHTCVLSTVQCVLFIKMTLFQGFLIRGVPLHVHVRYVMMCIVGLDVELHVFKFGQMVVVIGHSCVTKLY